MYTYNEIDEIPDYSRLESADFLRQQAKLFAYYIDEENRDVEKAISKHYRNVKINNCREKNRTIVGKHYPEKKDAIYIRQLDSITPYEKNYILAHEFGHLIEDAYYRGDSKTPKNIHKINGKLSILYNDHELGANYFAMNALLPQDDFLAAYSLEDGKFSALAKIFQVPGYVIRKRSIELYNFIK